jgi:hypothetical protein
MSAMEAIGWAGTAYNAYNKGDKLAQSSDRFEGGSGEKNARIATSGALGIIGGYLFGPTGASIGMEVGDAAGRWNDKYIMDRGWEAMDEAVEGIFNLENVTDNLMKTENMLLFPDPVSQGISNQVYEWIDNSCIVLTYLYGPYSKEVRYAKVFCARCIELEALLGYYQIGNKVIALMKCFKWLREPLRRSCVEPFNRYILHRLGRSRASIPDRIWGWSFLQVCKWYKRIFGVRFLPLSSPKCIRAVQAR